MGSLSIWTYYRNNKRKVVPLTGIIALAVLAISSTGALTESLFEDARREFLYLYDRYARVDSTRALGLSGPMMAQLAGHPAVTEVLPVESPGTRTQGIFGGSHVHIYFVPPAAQRPVASQLGWELAEGRWPEPGTNEVAMTQNFLRNRGLKVGDRIGHDVDEKDFLRGEWLVTGALSYSRAVGGVGDLDYYREFRLDELEFPAELIEGPGHVFVVPKEGNEAELEAFLDSLSEDEVRVNHRSKGERELADDIANANMVIWVLNGVTIVVISLSMGLLNVEVTSIGV